MEYSVSSLNAYIKKMFVSEYALNNITVRGEVADCKYHYSGHIYFTIKDKTSQLSCVMFAGDTYGLGFRMEQGDKVLVSGSVSVYERDGKYQLYARRIERAGDGELFRQFEELKKKLSAEGIFDEAHKKPIPRYALRVGIVTAEDAAALHDILRTVRNKNPYVKLYLRPAIVQGAKAALSIVQAIGYLDAYGVDVIIVARGGGSIEDLWPFNEEIVARAIYECRTPVITGVGHEVDFTIADFAADVRKATPTAAADAAVFDWNEFEREISDRYQTLFNIYDQKKTYLRLKLSQYFARLESMGPDGRVMRLKEALRSHRYRLDMSMDSKLNGAAADLNSYITKLDALSPIKRLHGGYGYITGEDSHAIESISQVKTGETVRIDLKDGFVKAAVTETGLR